MTGTLEGAKFLAMRRLGRIARMPAVQWFDMPMRGMYCQNASLQSTGVGGNRRSVSLGNYRWDNQERIFSVWRGGVKNLLKSWRSKK